MATILRKATHTACGALCTALRQSAFGGRPWLQAPLIIERNTPVTAAHCSHNPLFTDGLQTSAVLQTQDLHHGAQGHVVNVSRAAHILPTVPEQQSPTQAVQEPHSSIELNTVSTTLAKQIVTNMPATSQLQSTNNRGIADSFAISRDSASEPIQEDSTDSTLHPDDPTHDSKPDFVPTATQ